ncbi:MAG: tetratricopeptide repeat protein, partial [Planctomycetota bacterium]|nr:tetratricopeptide repeat protein [Planctomycetota bacterium]
LTPYLLEGTLSQKSISLLIRSAAKGDEVSLVGQATNRYLVLNPGGLNELIEIGNQLLYEGSGAASVAVFKILHDRTVGKTKNEQVILGLANSLARQFRFEESTRLLDTHREVLNSLASDLIIARGYQDMGHPFEAIALVDNILAHNPDDIDAIIIKAKSHADVGQYDFAESLLIRMTHKYPSNYEVKFALGEFYTRHARYEQASQAFADIHQASPVLIYAFDSMIKSLIREKNYSAAKMAIETFRTPHVFETPMTSASNLATARLFAAQGQLVEAIAIAKSEAFNNKQRRSEALLIIYAAAAKLKDQAMLEAAKLDLIAEASKSLSIGIQIADEASLNCHHDLAQHVLQELKSTSGGQIAVVNRLAESYLNGSSGLTMNAIAEFKNVLAFAPGNSRAKIGLVNAYQKVRDFIAAKALLAELVQQMPNHVDARRQFARLANARVGKKAGEIIYAQLQSELPENNLEVSPESIHGHVYALNTNVGSSQLHEAISLERQAKYMKDWRPTDSIGHYETLVQTEPGNLDAFFDLGQQYALKHRTTRAMDVYDRMLQIDPCNPDAQNAQIGLARSLQPLVEFNFVSIDQEGRVGLAEIKKLSFDWSYTVPLGDENEHYGFRYSHLVLDPDDDETLLGNAVGAFIQGRFWDSCSYYFGELDVEIYDGATRDHPNGRFKNRPVFDVGIGFELPMDINLELGGFLENVKENGETLRQDIYYGGGKIRAFWNPLPRWRIDGRWRFIEYSDENIRNDLMIENQLRLLSPPYELNFNFDYEFLAFSNQTIFSAGPGVFGTRHPYFAPSGFSLLGLGFEYKHWLSQDYYKGANHSWISMEYMPQWDSLNEFYMIAQFGIHHQHGNNITFGADFKITRSSVYDNDIATSYLKWYF